MSLAARKRKCADDEPNKLAQEFSPEPLAANSRRPALPWLGLLTKQRAANGRRGERATTTLAPGS